MVALGKLGWEEGSMQGTWSSLFPGWVGGVQGRGQLKPCPSPKQNRKGLRGPVWQQRNRAVQIERGRKGEWHRAPGFPMEEVLRH